MKNKISSLTSLKGIFCLIIVAFHTYDMEAIGEFIIFPYIKVLGGTLGNSFFFIISGFLITYNYKEKIIFRKINFKSYMVKRIVKLYPLYLITNLVALIRRIYMSGLESFDFSEFICIILMQAGGALKAYTPYNSVCWFACTLMVCYCVYFGITYIMKNGRQYYLTLIMVCAWGYILSINEWNFPFSYRTTGEALFNFFVGVLLVELISKVNKHNKKIFYIIQFGVICFLIVCDSIVVNVRILITFVVCPIVICLGIISEPCKKFLENKILIFLGSISTSIYFWHNLLWKIYSPLFLYTGLFKDIIKYSVYLILLVLCSYLSYQGIEKKFEDFYKRKYSI